MDIVPIMNQKKFFFFTVCQALVQGCSSWESDLQMMKLFHTLITHSSYRMENFCPKTRRIWSRFISQYLSYDTDGMVSYGHTISLALRLDNTLLLKYPTMVSDVIWFDRDKKTIRNLQAWKDHSCENFNGQNINLYDVCLVVQNLARKDDKVIPKDLMKIIANHVGDDNGIFKELYVGSAKCLQTIIQLSEGEYIENLFQKGIVKRLCQVLKMEERNGLLTIRNAEEMYYNWFLVLDKMLSEGNVTQWKKDNPAQMCLLFQVLDKAANCVNIGAKSLKLL